MPWQSDEEIRDREILAQEIKARGGPEDYIARLESVWQEIDNELPPELSSALVAMRRAREDERDIAAAKAALVEPGERVSLDSLKAKLS